MASHNLQEEIIEKQLDNLTNPETVSDIGISDSTITNIHQLITTASGEEETKLKTKEEKLQDFKTKFIKLSGEKKYSILKVLSELVKDINPTERSFRSISDDNIGKRRKRLTDKKISLLQKRLEASSILD